MKALINGIEVEGTPEEMATLVKAVDGFSKQPYIIKRAPMPPTFQPPSHNKIVCDSTTEDVPDTFIVS